MEVRHGRLLTKDRLRLLDEYKRRRHYWDNTRMSTYDYARWRVWIEDFEKFMCKGWDWDKETYVGAQCAEGVTAAVTTERSDNE